MSDKVPGPLARLVNRLFNDAKPREFNVKLGRGTNFSQCAGDVYGEVIDGLLEEAEGKNGDLRPLKRKGVAVELLKGLRRATGLKCARRYRRK